MQDYTTRQQIEEFQQNEKFLDNRCFYFYDWFCRDNVLETKAVKLMSQVIIFTKLMDVDLDNTYVFFKNNCPCVGSLYDDFRICDKESEDVIWTVTPKCGHKSSNGAAEVWGKLNYFEEPILSSKNWNTLLSDIASGKCKSKS
jgi:hypothetical protein